MFSLRISTTGMREPHWHPDTAEMGYVVNGHARMTVLSPDGDNKLDTYTLKPGDVYFIPRAYPHHIENIGSDETKFLIFFDQSVAGDIGFTGSFSAYSHQVLAATLDCTVNQLPDVPFYPEDLLIVKRVNPVEQ
jgi:oxalate decarboxylase